MLYMFCWFLLFSLEWSYKYIHKTKIIYLLLHTPVSPKVQGQVGVFKAVSPGADPYYFPGNSMGICPYIDRKGGDFPWFFFCFFCFVFCFLFCIVFFCWFFFVNIFFGCKNGSLLIVSHKALFLCICIHCCIIIVYKINRLKCYIT